MAHDVFISYSTIDKVTADAICAKLEQDGIRCWYAPRDVEPGSEWAASIIKAIETSRAMVLVFTEASNASRQVLNEVNAAVSAGVVIVPFRVKQIQPSEAMQYYLGAVHWLDVIDDRMEECIDQLSAQVRGIVYTAQPRRRPKPAATLLTPQDFQPDPVPVPAPEPPVSNPVPTPEPVEAPKPKPPETPTPVDPVPPVPPKPFNWKPVAVAAVLLALLAVGVWMIAGRNGGKAPADKAPAEVQAEPTESPATAEPAAQPTESPATEEPTAQPAEIPATAEPAEQAADATEAGLWVYRDDGDPENHYPLKMKMGSDMSLVQNMDEACEISPHDGRTCIRCAQTSRPGTWGGWLFVKGYTPEGDGAPVLNDGSTDDQGLDLTGAQTLTFWARGEAGGEKVTFVTCGLGHNSDGWAYPDSADEQSLGFVALENEWKQYTIDLEGLDLSYIGLGFGYVVTGDENGEGEVTFYLDDIRFNGNIAGA